MVDASSGPRPLKLMPVHLNFVAYAYLVAFAPEPECGDAKSERGRRAFASKNETIRLVVFEIPHEIADHEHAPPQN